MEILIAMTVFSVGALSYFSTFHSLIRLGEDSAKRDSIHECLHNAASRLRNSDFATLYANYEGQSMDATGLEAADGTTAQVMIDFDVDETNLSSEYGFNLDIDGDGALTTTDASTTCIIMPVHLSLTYKTDYGTDTAELFLVLHGSL